MERNNTPVAWEYSVAEELYRRGFSIGMTIGNAKAIDLFANKDNKTLSVQVKAIRNKKVLNGQWWRKVIYNVLDVFVNLKDQLNSGYYIATRQEALEKVKQYSTRNEGNNRLNFL